MEEKAKQDEPYKKKYCLCCLPMKVGMMFFTFVFSCDWFGSLMNLIKTDRSSLALTTFWFLLKTNLVTSFIMVWSNVKVQEAREILFRSFIAQFACEAIYFISLYIYWAVSDGIERECERWYESEDINVGAFVPEDKCVPWVRRTGLSAGAVFILCIYVPIRGYALRNIYHFKEELKHEADVASDITDEVERMHPGRHARNES